MKRIIALLGIGVCSGGVLVWLLVRNPGLAPIPGLKLGAPPSGIEAPYKTEYDWARREITAAIDDIAGNGSPGKAASPDGTIVPWHPELFTAYAASRLGSTTPDWNEQDPPDQYRVLVASSPDALLRSNAEVSSALKRNMRSARAHEAAALTVAAFALRECAEGFSDPRWALNRMTAHLAVASALRGGQSPPSLDGRLANVVLLALTDRQASALAALDAVDAVTPEAAAWQRALRLRVTQNWKAVEEPARATRLEKIEYFRARRATLRGSRAAEDVAALREPAAVDFGRIAVSWSFGVEDGDDFAIDGLMGELDELAYVYKQLHQRDLPKNLPAEIVNARAGALMTTGAPQVIPWGAWAEFANRHLGLWVVKVDRQYRKMQALPDKADRIKRELDGLLGHLTLYAVASTGRTTDGKHSDLTRIDKAIDVAIRTPELVNYDYWSFIQDAVNYEHVKRGMPAKALWFAAPSAEQPYDVAFRVDGNFTRLTPAAVSALMDEAPYNAGLAWRVERAYKNNGQLLAKVHEVAGRRADYDTWAMQNAMTTLTSVDDSLALQRKACAANVLECINLAARLVSTNEDEAAAEYQKAFDNPALDQVQMSNTSWWLVGYYERHGQSDKALELAERSGGVYSFTGLVTLGRLYERRSRFEDADEVFKATADRYTNSKQELAAFLYRRAVVAKQQEYVDRWNLIEGEIFPSGLHPIATAMPRKPEHGVFIQKDSAQSREIGLQAGDIIVGVDGRAVDNLQQYQTVMAFEPPDAFHKLTAWRGKLFTVDLKYCRCLTLATHPVTIN